MRKTTLSIALAGALVLPAAASASGYMEIHLELPEILPPLVVISPGVQVYPEIAHEVFFVDGVYWARHNGGWYRSETARGAWVGVPPSGVPASLGKIPPGKYKNWKPEKKAKGGGNGKKGKQ
jgi:hypothetical protein